LHKNLDENHNLTTKQKHKSEDSDDEVNALERKMEDVYMQFRPLTVSFLVDSLLFMNRPRTKQRKS
jgi:hypothetical protein